jgi:hypothetical protein
MDAGTVRLVTTELPGVIGMGGSKLMFILNEAAEKKHQFFLTDNPAVLLLSLRWTSAAPAAYLDPVRGKWNAVHHRNPPSPVAALIGATRGG